jgi:hypothetical protein
MHFEAWHLRRTVRGAIRVTTRRPLRARDPPPCPGRFARRVRAFVGIPAVVYGKFIVSLRTIAYSICISMLDKYPPPVSVDESFLRKLFKKLSSSQANELVVVLLPSPGAAAAGSSSIQNWVGQEILRGDVIRRVEVGSRSFCCYRFRYDQDRFYFRMSLLSSLLRC